METTAPNSPSAERLDERKNRLLVDFHAEETHWNKSGFWCALHNKNSPHVAFDNLVLECKRFHDEQRNQLASNHNLELQRFEEKVGNANRRITEIQVQLDSYKDTTLERGEIESLRTEIEGLESDLIEAYKKLGVAKKDLIQNQIDEVFADLEKITEKYEALADRYSQITNKAKSGSQDALNIKPELFQRLSQDYWQLLDKLKNRTSHLVKSGVAYFGRSRLIGYGTAIAAGWFFSVYALGKNLSNNDVPFFLITGLFKFGDFLKQGGGFYTALLNHVAFIFFILAALFVVTALCYLLLSRLEKQVLFSKMFFRLLFTGQGASSEDDSEAEKQLNKELSASPTARMSSKMFFSFWVESLPFLVVFGITFIVLSLGNTNVESLNLLSVSLSAQAVGTAMAIGFAGLVYLYITNVIEPRLERHREEGTRPRMGFLNVELASVIVLLALFILVLLFGIENTLFNSTNSLFAFSMFIICTLVSSLTLGYAAYYSGLNETINYLETKLQYLSLGTAYNSFPNIRQIIRTDNTFRRVYNDLVEKLLRLDVNKTKLAEKFFAHNDQLLAKKQERKHFKKNERRLEGLWKDLKNFFSAGSSDDQAVEESLQGEERIEVELAQLEERFSTLPEDREYFPAITCEIENYKGRLNGRIRRLVELELEVQNRREEKTYLARRFREESNELQEKISNWKKYLSVLRDINLKESEALFEKQYRMHYLMQDGFNLGLWFTTNGITPHDDMPKTEVTDAGFVQ
jgi:hypothetical protein